MKRTSPTRNFRWLTIAAAITTYLLIIVGGVVRITGSGLGCPDWPLCFGQPIPPPEFTAIIEYSHRSVAAIGGVLLLLVAIVAWMRYRHDAWIVVPATAVIALLVIQIPLGAVIVATELSPLAVAFHLGMALIIFANILITAVAANHPDRGAARSIPLGYQTLLVSSLAMLFLLVITGTVVVGGGASHLCPEWPLCNGQLIPLGQADPGLAMQLLHRYTVFVVSFLIIAVITATLRLRAGGQLWAWVLGGLFVAQIGVGALQVTLGMPALWRSMHLALAAGVWASLVVLTSLSVLRAAAPAKAVPESARATLQTMPR